MSYCQCEHPRQNDRRPAYCRCCGVQLDPRWVSSDEVMLGFYQRISDFPGVGPHVILAALQRARAGRAHFGLKYLGRDNAAEGQEEAADGVNYCAFEWLNDRREGTEDVDPDLLDAAHHFAQAHAALERRRHRDRS